MSSWTTIAASVVPVTPDWRPFMLVARAGTTVVVERDSSEFARLAQLGDILGLNQFDVASVRPVS
jgi:hypothetical protein